MDFETANTWWESLNKLYKNNKKAYRKFVKKNLERLHNTKTIRPKYGFCVFTDVKKIFLKTKFNEYTENISKYYVYVYHSKKMKASTVSEEALKNTKALNFDNIYISVCKIKGETDKNFYAQAVIHSDLFQLISNNPCLKNQIVMKILDIVNKHEGALSSDIFINPQEYQYIEVTNYPKTYHYLNPECVDYNLDSDDESIEDMEDVGNYYYGVPRNEASWEWYSQWKKYIEEEKNNKQQKKETELKLYNLQPGVVGDLHSVQTVKKRSEDNVTLHVPKQVKSYYYKILNGFLHIYLTFKDVTYNDLEILKVKNNVRIFVSTKHDEAMSLNYAENLSDNMKAYFDEKLNKLTLSIELL